MQNKLSPARKRLFWIFYTLLLLTILLHRGYDWLEKNYFPEKTECNFYSRLSGSQCIFAIPKSNFNHIGFFTADSQSIIFLGNNDKALEIKPIGALRSMFSGQRFEHPYRIERLALSLDRTKAVTCIARSDNFSAMEFWIWDIEKGSLIKKVDALPFGCAFSMYQGMEISADGESLILNLDNRNQDGISDVKQIGIINLESGALTRKLIGGAFALSRDGHYMAIQYGKEIKLLNYSSLGTVRNFDASNVVGEMDFSFSPESKYLIGRDGLGLLYVWDVETGRFLNTLQQLSPDFCVPVFSVNNDKMFSCSFENQRSGPAYESFAFMWGVKSSGTSGSPIALEQIIKLGSRELLPESLDVSPDGKKLLVVGNDFIQVFEIAD